MCKTFMSCQVHDRGVGLSWVGLEPDDDALILAVALHLRVAVVADGEDVRRQFADLALLVEFDLVGRVDGQDLVRVDSHQDRARVRLRAAGGRPNKHRNKKKVHQWIADL